MRDEDRPNPDKCKDKGKHIVEYDLVFSRGRGMKISVFNGESKYKLEREGQYKLESKKASSSKHKGKNKHEGTRVEDMEWSNVDDEIDTDM